MERTLLILKPSAVQRSLIGEILSRFERRGLKLVALKMAQLTPEVLKKHYAHLIDCSFYPSLEESMMASPVVLCCLEGVEAVNVVREMAGSTNGRHAAPGTIRGDYCVSSQMNIVHTSDSPKHAQVELSRFFKEDEYFDYELPTQNYLYSIDEF